MKCRFFINGGCWCEHFMTTHRGLPPVVSDNEFKSEYGKRVCNINPNGYKIENAKNLFTGDM